jgi:hypothetical protein
VCVHVYVCMYACRQVSQPVGCIRACIAEQHEYAGICVCVHVHVCMHVDKCPNQLDAFVHVSQNNMSMRVYVYVCVCTFACMYVCMYVCYVRMYVRRRMYVCMYACMYVSPQGHCKHIHKDT